jgi:hypothetical protein
MIVINAIEENGTIAPQRMLTLEEQLTVTSSVCNGIEYIYYQGDEPIVENEEII